MTAHLVFELLFGLACLLVFCFGVVLVRGAPFLPTLKPQVDAALDMLDLQKGQTLLELGCGDGRVLIAAAMRGWKAVGYELNPIMAFIAWARTRPYRTQVKVIWGDYWTADWPKADAIFAFLLTRYMRILDKKIVQYPHKPILLASFAFPIPNRSPKTEKSGVFLYEYK